MSNLIQYTKEFSKHTFVDVVKARNSHLKLGGAKEVTNFENKFNAIQRAKAPNNFKEAWKATSSGNKVADIAGAPFRAATASGLALAAKLRKK